MRAGNTRLVFEKSVAGLSSVSYPSCDVPQIPVENVIPKELLADALPSLPELSERMLAQHISELSDRAMYVDRNFYPLGSCTMKYNPKINEWAASLEGFRAIHPYQDIEDVQGALKIMYELRCFLERISGLDEVSLLPAAGAHGELTSLMVIRKYFEDRGEDRPKVLIPDSAHGTNPASCSLCGKHVVVVRSTPEGLVDLKDLKSKVDKSVAALMITNPNTLGLFEKNILEISRILHDNGCQLYLDGANFNAIIGYVRPADFGVDIMHFNLHKTFSTPHGCGGPGAGPIAAKAHLAEYLPIPQVEYDSSSERYFIEYNRPKSIGRVRSFYGQFLVCIKAYAYIRALGPEGLKDVAEYAVLSANYIASKLKDYYSLPYGLPCMHEFVLSALGQKKYGVRALDIAKRLIDFGIHPPTMYFPLIVPESIMIEPTETESKEMLDYFIECMIRIAKEAEEDPHLLYASPHTSPVARVDEVQAARFPDLRYKGTLKERQSGKDQA